jgi:hypothetical protein
LTDLLLQKTLSFRRDAIVEREGLRLVPALQKTLNLRRSAIAALKIVG